MTQSVFYSWQSDLRAAACRTLIGDALNNVVFQLASDKTLNVDPVVDRDTQNVPGSPDIAAAIFAKIDSACAFVADVTIVARTARGKLSPNPNVLVELGYALKVLGDTGIVLVQNTALGGPEVLPFDLRQKRVLTYASAPDDSDRAPARRALETKLMTALRAIVSHKEEENPDVKLTLDYTTQSRTQEIHHYLLVVSLENTGTRRIDDWEVEVEFPTRLLVPGVDAGLVVPERSSAAMTFFRTSSTHLRIGDRYEITIPYRVDQEIFRDRTDLLGSTVVARTIVDGDQVAQVERSVSELNNF